MFVERAEIPVQNGMENDFAKMMSEKGTSILAGAEGCSSAKVGRGVESPDKFILLLEWDAVESHIKFTKTAEFAEFVTLAKPYFAGPSDMQHFKLID
jgi:heme-degrading monooxygenase HmoA